MSDEQLAGIRLVAFDVDGVFTDGRLYLSDRARVDFLKLTV